MKAIVTGGAGFIGSAVVWRLNRLGIEDILIVDRGDETEKWKNLVPLRFADYIDADDFIENPDAHNETEIIFHLGACSTTTERDARYMLANNFEYTKHLASWACENNIRFIYASSAATYGDGSAGMEDGFDNLESLRPLNVYGYSKHLFDQWAARKGMFDRIVGLKYFNVFGPNEYHKKEMRSLVNKAVEQIRETGNLRLFKSHNPDYADGEFGRDFIYVKDAVDMTIYFMESSVGGLFNIGSGRMTTWNELAGAIFAALGQPPSIEYIEMPESIRGQYQYYTKANLARMRNTGYVRKPTPIAEAVSDYVVNYLLADKRLGE